MSIRKYSMDEVSSLLTGQTRTYMARQPQTLPNVSVWPAPENTAIIAIQNLSADNAYVQAKSIIGGDDFAKDGVYFPGVLSGNYFDVLAGDMIFGRFSHFSSKASTVLGTVSVFKLTLMGV